MVSCGECAMVGPACDALRWCWTGSSIFRGNYVLVKLKEGKKLTAGPEMCLIFVGCHIGVVGPSYC